MRYITKTKNLFDISKLQAYTPETLPTNTAGVYNGTIIAKAGSSNAVSNSGKLLKELCPDLVADERYTLSFKSNAKYDAVNIYLRGAGEFWKNNTSSVVTEAKLNSFVCFYANYPDITVATISNFQIEKSSTATPYVPYGYLPMRRMKYRVNEYCQLMDKSKFPGVITNAGVTTTSNGDGSITINGTATKSTYINCTPAYPKENNGHVFYICANNTTMSKSTWQYGLLNQSGLLDYGDGMIGKTNTKLLRSTGITFNNGVVFDNVIIKPQLFDLTEMYGAGNEPTTVEQFRQDYPNELYEYSPYCWASMKNIRYVTTTKNLWTCDKTMFHVIYNSGTQVFKVTNTGSESCYTLPTPIPSGTTLTITVYCLSGHTKDVVTIGGYHNETGNTSWQCDCNLPINIDLSGKSFSQTVITTNTLTDFWIFVYGLVPNNLQFKVQIELGDTATDYVPYGYLPLK